ncbi:cilia- and flagella-associated protein 161 isoform X3 [Hippoglossus hippoglossus]|uniref:cilia- and flagella-associated protein 161 isoform X3 n=1 Tax=Hippoglossus hippoglossus TaxID=8267 RepID=UPI00148C9F63|nr:cilia- and flagella-associated protein 161 isoform X3 [Hippoglossus hippoglossus]
MAQRRVFSSTVKVGNWNEELLREEEAKKAYLEKKERGELVPQKRDFLKQNILGPVNLSMSNDGRLHFGDVVMLVNMGGENRECSAVSINADVNNLITIPSPGIQSPCGVSAGRGILPCTRTAFIITSVDGSPEGSTLLYEQSFALTTTSGFARGCAKISRLQEVNLVDEGSFLSWWKIVHFDPQERLEYEGQPVPADMKVVIVHCKTNQALAVMGDHILWTTYGKEYEVTAHTFLDTHKAEEDKNHWVLCNPDPAGARLVPLDHPESAGDNKEPTQGNTDGV